MKQTSGSILAATSLACGILFWSVEAMAQGTFAPVVLNTGGLTPLVSESVTLATPESGDRIQFEFGFATDETFAPLKIFDSFSVTLQTQGASEALQFATIDSSGAAFVPLPGAGIQLDPALIDRMPVSFRVNSSLATKSAFLVSFPVAPGLTGAPLQVFFDLFDNQDSVASLGYFTGVTLVPEPTVCTLALAAAGVWLLRRKIR